MQWMEAMPTNNLLASLFGRSPIGPIKKHITTVHSCVLTLDPFFQAIIANEWDIAYQTQSHIVQAYSESNAIKSSIRRSLPKSLFLPVPRSDLLTLVTLQDRVAVRTREIASLVVERRMVIPSSINQIFMETIHKVLKVSAQALKAVNELDSLLETGFQGREIAVVGAMLEELEKLKHQAGEDLAIIRAQLFEIETHLSPIEAMFLYKLLDWIGELVETTAQVGSHLQLLLAN